MKQTVNSPTFLGIGAKKSGSTWIYQLLKSHDEIYMPKYRKELHFFDWNYSKGFEWYQDFFPSKKKASHYKEFGEFSPSYIYDKQAPERIKRKLPDSRFILILRDPTERLISAYKYYKQRGGRNSFKTFSKFDDDPFKQGLYSHQIRRWFQYFGRDKFLILIFENAVSNPLKTKKKLSNFLEIDSDGFSESGENFSNKSFPVRFKKLYLLGVKTAKILRSYKMDILINYFNQMRLNSVFRKNSEFEITISQDRIKQLASLYKEDINELEKLIDCDLSVWKSLSDPEAIHAHT